MRPRLYTKLFDKKTYERERYWSDPDRHKARNRARSALIKAETIKAYGGECKCCGESDYNFLVLDHVHNDGASHRREIGKTYGHRPSSVSMFRWAKKNDYPDILQLLCANCNLGKQINGGTCPHVES